MSKKFSIFRDFLLPTVFPWQILASRKSLETNSDALKKLNNFKEKEKFIPENSYSGAGTPSIKFLMAREVNAAADDFISATESKGSERQYIGLIKTGLRRFNDMYSELDTEDRERVAKYFEELMDIVGLRSSYGLLNKWMYAVNPAEKF